MLSFSWVILFLAARHQEHHFPLPPSAVITIDAGENIEKSDPTFGDFDCTKYRLTEKEVRRQFATYHLIDGPEFHDKYSRLPCLIRGTVTVNGRTFHWESNDGNWMSVEYPDGEWRTLGGKPSGDLSW